MIFPFATLPKSWSRRDTSARTLNAVAWRRRQCLIAGRRDRRHEGHAGVRDGKDARDRFAPGLGARGRDVLLQFLIEAVTPSGVGALIGTVLGIAIAIITAIYAGGPAVIPAKAVLLSAGSSILIGIFFGWHPATGRAPTLERRL
jgi:hypothetical protein